MHNFLLLKHTLMALVVTAVAAASAIAQAPPGAPTGVPVAATPTIDDAWPGMKKLLLVADVQNGFHHDSISHAIGVIEQMGRESGEWVTIIRTDSQLLTKQPILGQGARYTGRPVNARNLNYFDAVFFLGSGAGTLTAQQKADLLSYIREDGKGFVAGHAATVAYFDWPEFLDMIGGFMESEYRVDTMALLNADPAFPGASAFPASFNYTEQYPVIRQPFSSKDVHVILRVDPRKMTEEQLKRRPDGDLPVVWAKPYGKGRVYNLTLGHQEQVWDDPKFRTLAKEGIRWALGLVDADVKPGNSTVPQLKK